MLVPLLLRRGDAAGGLRPRPRDRRPPGRLADPGAHRRDAGGDRLLPLLQLRRSPPGATTARDAVGDRALPDVRPDRLVGRGGRRDRAGRPLPDHDARASCRRSWSWDWSRSPPVRGAAAASAAWPSLRWRRWSWPAPGTTATARRSSTTSPPTDTAAAARPTDKTSRCCRWSRGDVVGRLRGRQRRAPDGAAVAGRPGRPGVGPGRAVAAPTGSGARSCGAARSPLMPSLVWAAWGLAALTSSGNKGTGFLSPLVPAFAVLTAWAIWRLPRPAARALAAVAVGVARAQHRGRRSTHGRTGSRSTGSGCHGWAARPSTTAAASSRATSSDGQAGPGHRPADRAEGRAPGTGPSTWLTTDAGRAELGPAFAVFGFRHRLVNINTVQLEQLLAGRPVLPLTMVDPVDVPNDEQAMTDYLTTGAADTACLLLDRPRSDRPRSSRSSTPT